MTENHAHSMTGGHAHLITEHPDQIMMGNQVQVKLISDQLGG